MSDTSLQLTAILSAAAPMASPPESTSAQVAVAAVGSSGPATASVGRFPSPAQILLRTEQSPAQADPALAALFRELGLSQTFAKILVGRGLKSEADVRAFLSPNFREHLPDPATIKNIIPAADLVLDFVKSGEQITVYSDFDVDGLSSGAQLYLALKLLGANVNTYVPSRFTEGYGLVMGAVRKLHVLKTKLLVTVDCGITSHDELLLARTLGMKTVVIDHHQPTTIPEADVVVDPAQEGCPFQPYKLAAAGLVWMFLIVLRQRIRERSGEFPSTPTLEPKDFLDLAVLGTVCDMVPLVSVNRLIAHRGLEALRVSQRPGLRALCDVAGLTSQKTLGAGNVGFALGPRINAAGRLSEAGEVIEMLTTDNAPRARKLAEKLDSLNARRRAVEEEIRASCLRIIRNSPELLEKPAFALFDDSFHVGVIGIAAQRVLELYHRPVAVMAPGEMRTETGIEPIIKGSVRSISGFHVAEVLTELREHLISGGGHGEAGGFSLQIENLAAFQAAFVKAAEQRLTPDQLRRRKTADIEIRLDEVSFPLADELQRLAPFGIGNPAPLLVIRDVHVDSVTPMSGLHARVRVRQGSVFHNAVAWGLFGHPLLQRGEVISIAFHLEARVYKGLASLQLELKEVWQ